MIQRIQSIYLLLAAIAVLLLLAFPIAHYEVTADEISNEVSFTVDGGGITLNAGDKEFENIDEELRANEKVLTIFNYGKAGFIALGFFSLICIFIYEKGKKQRKRRKLQKNLVMVNIILHLLLIGGLLSAAAVGEEILRRQLEDNSGYGDVGVSYAVGFYMVPVAVAFLFLAWRGIRKDEKLISSLDRIR